MLLSSSAGYFVGGAIGGAIVLSAPDWFADRPVWVIGVSLTSELLVGVAAYAVARRAL